MVPLVRATAEDKKFRGEHEARLQEIWKEVLAVKTRLGDVQDSRKEIGVLFEDTQAELNSLRDECRREIKELKTQTDDLSTQMNHIPLARDGMQQFSARRIQEAISSTRRWNREHKVTEMSDAVFTTNYLKQQCKRDRDIAVFIQKNIQRRLRRRQPSSRRRVKSLEEFCKDVAWNDVLETVEDVLIKDDRGP